MQGKWGVINEYNDNVFDLFVLAVSDDHSEVGPCPYLSGLWRFCNDLLGNVRVGSASCYVSWLVGFVDNGGSRVVSVDHGSSVELGNGIGAAHT